ncbi:MAG: hypothetical protein JNK72_12130 [Myxococcales bacterium]|nr:hypothetical protein [Myxococcales bacterium]
MTPRGSPPSPPTLDAASRSQPTLRDAKPSRTDRLGHLVIAVFVLLSIQIVTFLLVTDGGAAMTPYRWLFRVFVTRA